MNVHMNMNKDIKNLEDAYSKIINESHDEDNNSPISKNTPEQIFEDIIRNHSLDITNVPLIDFDNKPSSESTQNGKKWYTMDRSLAAVRNGTYNIHNNIIIIKRNDRIYAIHANTNNSSIINKMSGNSIVLQNFGVPNLNDSDAWLSPNGTDHSKWKALYR